jgi:hypothetical protein
MVSPIVSVFGANVFQHLVAVGAAFGPAGAFISPLSIYIALALALNGASEQQRRESVSRIQASDVCVSPHGVTMSRLALLLPWCPMGPVCSSGRPLTPPCCVRLVS